MHKEIAYVLICKLISVVLFMVWILFLEGGEREVMSLTCQ